MANPGRGTTPFHLVAAIDHNDCIFQLFPIQGTQLLSTWRQPMTSVRVFFSCSPSRGGTTPLHLGAANDHNECIFQLFPIQGGTTPLKLAAANDHNDCIFQLFLIQGAQLLSTWQQLVTTMTVYFSCSPSRVHNFCPPGSRQ